MPLLLAVHFAAAWYMTGVIWVVQILHYPMMGRTGVAFADCQKFHLARTGAVVGPAMLIEAATGLALIFFDPADVILLVCTALLAAIWLSTFLVQVPRHRRLSDRFDPLVHSALVRTNWFRTVAWTARGILLMAAIT